MLSSSSFAPWNLDILSEHDDSYAYNQFSRQGVKNHEANSLRLRANSRVELIALGQVAQAPQKHETADSKQVEMNLYPTTEIQWKDGPASLPAGAKVAVLEGDPSKEGFFHNASLVAGRFQDSTSLAPKGRACDRHFGDLQWRYGREV